MSLHRYPPKALLGDYLRAGFGLLLTLGPALAVPGDSAALWVLLPLALLFAVFGVRTLARHKASVELTQEGVTLSTWTRSTLKWSDLQQFRVDYYSTRGDRSGGWMQLKAKGSGTTIQVDSAIDEFVAIAGAAAAAARSNGVEISEATRVNLGHLGIAIEP